MDKETDFADKVMPLDERIVTFNEYYASDRLLRDVGDS